MIELKKDEPARVPVRFYDSSTGLPVAGVIVSAVVATVERADGTSSTLTLTGDDWAETTLGAFSGAGKYTLVLPATATSVPGCLVYAVASTGRKTYLGAVKVVANEEVDTFTAAQRVLDLTEGRWVLDKVLKQMVIYKPDGVTELRRYNMFNDLGNPDIDVVFDKVPVIP